MAQVDKHTIKTLIQLSRIDCTIEEQDVLLEDLKNVLAYFEQLQEINTEDVPPCHHVLEGIQNVMRPDAIGKLMSREDFLANAPSQVGGMIRIPPIFKQG
jgi:aspartyl-tRNA(Asn)/glutamyl-tRNA(Gln) amidotransferase subunit C